MRKRLAALAFAALAFAGTGAAVAAPVGDIEIASTTSDGQPAAGWLAFSWGYSPLWSPDGAKLLFDARASNFFEGATDTQLAVKDFRTGALANASSSKMGVPGNARSFGTPGVLGYSSVGPRWSPDGRRVAFWSLASNLVDEPVTPGLWHIYVKDVVTGDTLLIDSTSDGTPARVFEDPNTYANVPSVPFQWSPDSRRLAFLSNADNLAPGAGGPSRWNLYVKDVVTRATTLVSVGAAGVPMNSWLAEINDFDWSPNSDALAFDWTGPDAGMPARAYVKDLATGSLTELAPGADKADLPRWSPDGRRILLRTVRQASTDPQTGKPLYTTNLAIRTVGGPLTMIVASEPSTNVLALTYALPSLYAPDLSPTPWSPDGRRIFFHAPFGGVLPDPQAALGGYFAADADGGNMIAVCASPTDPFDDAPCTDGVASPNGRLFAFVSSTAFVAGTGTGSQVFVMDVTNAAIAVASADNSGTPLDGEFGEPIWSPDGTQLLFSDRINGQVYEHYVKDLGSGHVSAVERYADGRALTSFGSQRLTWSPDSSRIAFKAVLTDNWPQELQAYVKSLRPFVLPSPGDPVEPQPIAPPPVIPQQPLDGFAYVALGDSYSAGEGVDPYFRDGFDADTGSQPGHVDNRCHRSTRAYAELVQPPGYSRPLYEIASGGGNPGTGKRINKYGSDSNVRADGGVAWAFWACSGARSPNVLPSSVGGVAQEDVQDLRPQLDNAPLSRNTALVSITIGGNDAGFADVLKHCFLRACNTRSYRKDRRKIIDSLSAPLLKTYRSIRIKAPRARVVVLGYPQVFPATSAEQGCLKLRPWSGEMTFLRDLATRLNHVVETAAGDAGVQYQDVAELFAGHEVCGNLGEWINGPSATWKLHRVRDDESFHPTLVGQRAYAAAMNSAIARLVGARTSIRRKAGRVVTMTAKGTVRVPAASSCGPGPCSVTVVALARESSRGAVARAARSLRVRLGTNSFALGTGESRRPSVRLHPGARALVRDRRRLRASFVITLTDGVGKRTRRTLRVTLRR